MGRPMKPRSWLRLLLALAPMAVVPALVMSCGSRPACLFSSGKCGGDEEPTVQAPAPNFGPSDPTLDGGCDDSLRSFDAAGTLDAGDGITAAPGARCSTPFDCAPVRCLCADGGAWPTDDDEGHASDASDGGDDGATALTFSVGARACVCAVRACATPQEACALATRFGACELTIEQ